MKGETTNTAPRFAAPGLSPVGALVRRHDRNRYQTALFAPSAQREALFALYAFNFEIARVRESVTQPMLGQIRLQWWREVVDTAHAGGPPRRHEIAVPLTTAIREYRLSRVLFDRLIDARERDLDDEPFASLAALEEYAEASSVPLVQLALEALAQVDPTGPDASPLARPIGTAYALAGLLRAMPYQARVGRSRASPVPPADIAASAHRCLEEARRLAGKVPRASRPALLPAVIARRYLARLKLGGGDPLAPAVQKPDTLQVWHLALAMLTGRL